MIIVSDYGSNRILTNQLHKIFSRRQLNSFLVHAFFHENCHRRIRYCRNGIERLLYRCKIPGSILCHDNSLLGIYQEKVAGQEEYKQTTHTGLFGNGFHNNMICKFEVQRFDIGKNQLRDFPCAEFIEMRIVFAAFGVQRCFTGFELHEQHF